jgi:hypothetical protein
MYLVLIPQVALQVRAELGRRKIQGDIRVTILYPQGVQMFFFPKLLASC